MLHPEKINKTRTRTNRTGANPNGTWARLKLSKHDTKETLQMAQNHLCILLNLGPRLPCLVPRPPKQKS